MSTVPPAAPPTDLTVSTPDTPTVAVPGAPATSPVVRRLRAVRALLWAAVAVMTLVWLFYAGGLESITALVRPAPKSVTTADIGQPAPALQLPLVGGGETNLEAFKGRPVVVNFWATWCEPCRAEMPALERAQQKYRDQGLAVIGVDMQERDDEIQAFLTQVGVTFPSLVDRTGEVTRQWRATGLPTTFLIDRQGIIQDVRVGPFTDEMLDDRLKKILAG
ncbi:MAG: TlpA family protein disulfide reductase [Chloroflexi bacterium]|nr:TlpA family protein disulfide reductase [Chloroflexota bacterium]